MRKILVLLFLLISVVTFGQGEIIKVGQKALKRNAKILKAHYPWEYTEPADWVNIHYCPKDEMLLLVNDSAERYIAFYCEVASSGQYSVDIYGGIRADSLIYTQTLSTTVKFYYQIPLGIGKSYGSNGYTQYVVRVFPKLKTKKITNFSLREHPSSTMAGVNILLANINMPSLLVVRFNSPTVTAIYMRYCNLYTCSNLTTLYYAFFGCTSLYTVTFSKQLDKVTTIVGAFPYCTSLHHVWLPKRMDKVILAGYVTYGNYSCFANCTSLLYVVMPQSMKLVTDFSYVFYNCKKLKYLFMPKYAPAITTMRGLVEGCDSIKYVRLPMIVNNVVSMERCFSGCYVLEDEDIEMPISMKLVTNFSYLFHNCKKLKKISFLDTLNLLTTMDYCFKDAADVDTIIMPKSATKLVTLTNNTGMLELDSISTCTFGTGMANVQFTFRDLKTFKQPTLRVSKFICTGQSLSVKSSIHTINIDWANSTYGGTSPQIDIRWNSLSATTIDAIFTALPVVTGKTINVAGNIGSATCTPAIATAKGWTVTVS